MRIYRKACVQVPGKPVFSSKTRLAWVKSEGIAARHAAGLLIWRAFFRALQCATLFPPDASMKLLGSPYSPFVLKARIALLEKNIAFEFVIDRPVMPGSQILVHNPLGKMPVLVPDAGRAVYDSVVIVEYADHVGDGPRLIPEKFEARIDVLRMAALGDGITDAIVLLTHDDRYKQPGCDPQAAWYQKQLTKIERGVAAIEREVADRDFCCGNAFTAGDISAGMALGYLDKEYPGYDWRAKFPGLKSYAHRLFARESFRQALPPPRSG